MMTTEIELFSCIRFDIYLLKLVRIIASKSQLRGLIKEAGRVDSIANL